MDTLKRIIRKTLEKIRRRKKIAWISAGLIVLVAAVFYLLRGKSPATEFYVVKKTDITQEVSVTGRVKPVEDVDLAFEKSGRVSRVYVKVGDSVLAGETLVQLENNDLVANLNQAEASVKSAQAKLDETLRGSRPEEIQVQEAEVESAKTAVLDAEKNLVDKINDAYVKSDDAVRNKADQFFNNPPIPAPRIIFSTTDSQGKINLEQKRILIEETMKSWKSIIDLRPTFDDPELRSYASSSKTYLDKVKDFLDSAALVLSSATPSLEATQANIDSWRTDISTARTNIAAAIANLSAALEKLNTAESNLIIAQKELNLKSAPATDEAKRAAEAAVEEAQANADNIRAQISKTLIKAPISGIVTKADAKVGEIVNQGATVVSLISQSDFEMEAFIPEADIAKVKVGDEARVTLDAYGEDTVWSAKVMKIDPGETVIEGVSTYKTTLVFSQKDERIKSGMTANIDIITASRPGVLAVPQRSVSESNGRKTVRILAGENLIEEREIKTGIRGVDGNVEIVEGLSEGDKVITSAKAK